MCVSLLLKFPTLPAFILACSIKLLSSVLDFSLDGREVESCSSGLYLLELFSYVHYKTTPMDSTSPPSLQPQPSSASSAEMDQLFTDLVPDCEALREKLSQTPHEIVPHLHRVWAVTSTVVS